MDAYKDAGDQVAANAALDQAATLAAAPEQRAEVLVRRFRLADQHMGMRALAEQALRLAPQGTEVRANILYDLCDAHRMECNEDAIRLGRMAVEEAAAVKVWRSSSWR